MGTKTWLGTNIEDMCDDGRYNFDVPILSPSKYHAVLFDQPVDLKAPPKPHHYHQTHHWDCDHVRMPYSSNNLFPIKNENGEDVLEKRWELIEKSLLQPISKIDDLEAAINSYNTRLPKFLALQHFFNEVLGEEEREAFFETLLPRIINLALQLPEIVPGNLPLLKTELCRSISLTQLQIACLLANGFLCTFPWRKDVSGSYPGLNFVRLFAAHLRLKRVQSVSEKFKCIFHYFKRILLKAPVGVVTFERKFLQKNQVPRWDKLENNLGNTRLHITNTGTIEDDEHGFLQVDFANKFVGGGVLGYGCVQEEIRYVICPELIISRLFTEELGSREALVITGAERFSNYLGYGDTFTWDGNHEDQTPFDNYGRRHTTVVAIDAIHFNKPSDQFNSSFILRELNKAYVGFHSRCNGKLAPVATGNWGCGAFRGDPRLKYMLQLMACSAANRNMVYYTFGDSDLRDVIYDSYSFLATQKVTINQLWRLLCRFTTADLSTEKFLPFIQQAYFDTKNQPSIKNYFVSSTKSPKENPAQNIDNAIATTSFNGSSEVDVDSDVVESSQKEELNFQEFKYKKFKHKSKRSKYQNEIINLINVIEGEENVMEMDVNVESSSLLSCLDEMSKTSKGSEENHKDESVFIDMDVENIVEGLCENKESVMNLKDKVHSDSSKVKRKISDYFVKVNK